MSGTGVGGDHTTLRTRCVMLDTGEESFYQCNPAFVVTRNLGCRSGVMERKYNHTRQDAGPDEGRVPRERSTLPLRKGGEADVRLALGFLDHAGFVLRHHPEHFPALLAIADGRPGEAGHASVVHLKRLGILDRDGVLPPECSAVLRSSYEITGDGPHLSMPFDLKVVGALEVIEQVQHQMTVNLRDFLHTDGTDGHGR